MRQSFRRERAEILVIQPDALDPLARFSEWLEHGDIEIRLIKPFAGEEIPQNLESEGLIVLGGSMNAYNDDDFPWLADIRNLYRQAEELGVPALGICLGAQVLATSFDGEVTVNAPAGPEYGLVEILWTEAACSDELVSGLNEPFLAGAFHNDAVTTLPSGSIRLGTGNRYPNQVFRRGSAVGVQFHPEVSPAQMKQWMEVSVANNEESEKHLADAFEEFTRFDSLISQHQRLLAHRFVQTVLKAARAQVHSN